MKKLKLFITLALLLATPAHAESWTDYQNTTTLEVSDELTLYRPGCGDADAYGCMKNFVPTYLRIDSSGNLSGPTSFSAGNVSATEFDYLDGLTGNIQTQLDGKQVTLTTGNLTANSPLSFNNTRQVIGGAAAVSIADAAADGATKGAAAFNATNFTASSGVVNTVQNINTGASPTFANLTVSDHVAVNGAALKTWTNGGVVQGTTGGMFFGESYDLHFSTNAYFNSGWKYMGADKAAGIIAYDGEITFRTAGVGSADAALTWTPSWKIINTGHLWTDTDNTFDIGATGNFRPRNLYVAGSAVYGTGSNTPQIKFNYDINSGGDFTGQAGGTDMMSFGFNNNGTFGGTFGASSGRTIYFYDRVAATYRGALNSDGAWFFGASITNYNLKIDPPTHGTAAWYITANGHLIAPADNTFDIGASGATRPRNVYVAGTGTFGGDVTVADEAYGSGWNGSVEVPTKNAVYDKIEALLERPTVVPFNNRADATTSLTAMSASEQFFPVNSKRAITKIDLTRFSQVRFVINVVTGATASGKIALQYKTSLTYATDVASDFSDIGTSEVSGLVTTAGVIDTGWIDLASGAKADVYVVPVQSSGDGTNTPGIGHMYAHFR